MLFTEEQLAAAERKLTVLDSAVSDREDVAILKIVYRDKWVKFDVTTMQLQHSTPEQLYELLRPALEAVGAPTQPAVVLAP